MAVLALGVGACYLWWRTTTLGSGSQLAIAVPVLVLEFWAYVELLLLTLQSWRLPPATARSRSGRPDGTVDIVVIAAGADPDDLERTLISCRAVRGRDRIIVVDDERRIRHRALATDAGASYRIDRRALSAPGLAAHRNTTAALYLWLMAGQLPTADLLEVAGPRFVERDLAVCQLAIRLLNQEDLAHLGRDADDDALVNNVVGPGLSRWGAGPWIGPASVVRRRAIEAIGGFDRHVPIDRLGARLHGAGWTTAFERRQLVAATAPESIDLYLAKRRRDGGAALSVLLSPDGPLNPRHAMTVGQRVAHLAAAARHATSLRLLGLATAAVAVVLSGAFPAETPAFALLVSWAAVTALSSAAKRALARGTMGYGDWLRQGWRVLGADVAAAVDAATKRVGTTVVDVEPDRATGGWRSLLHLPLVQIVVLTVDAALLVRAASLLDRDLLPAFTGAQRVVTIGFAIALLVPIVDMLQVIVVRQQQRTSYRIQAELDATVDGTPARTVDITPEGAGVLLAAEPAIGSTVSLEISLPGADGVIRRIVATAVTRAARPEGTDRWRAGFELTQMAAPARQALVAFCAELESDDIDEDQATALDPVAAQELRRRRSLRRITLGAGVAGLATMVFGPTVASASTTTPHLVESVCVVDPDGGPVPEVGISRLTGDVADVLGATTLTGCLDVGAVETTTGFTIDHRGLVHELQPADYRTTEAVVTLRRWAVRVYDLDATPRGDVEVRYFSDRWLATAPPTAVDEGHRFDAPPVDGGALSVEVTLDGSRLVRAFGADGVIVLSRVRLEPEVDEAGQPVTTWLDRGRGWEPAGDGMELVPGRIVVRTGDGTILRLDVPEASELRLPAGDIVPVEVELPELPVDEQPQQPADGEVPADDPDGGPLDDPIEGTTSTSVVDEDTPASTAVPTDDGDVSTSEPASEPGDAVDPGSTSTAPPSAEPTPTTVPSTTSPTPSPSSTAPTTAPPTDVSSSTTATTGGAETSSTATGGDPGGGGP
ncbi:MAG: PilZ domain-containing protein [Actinomycetota bacterium]